MPTTLVTGGAGFIGSAFVRLLLKARPDRKILNLDRLTYAGHRSNLAGVLDHPNHRLVVGDVADPSLVEALFAPGDIDEVVHFAAESHVDRSIDSPAVFLRTNILGTQVLLDAARSHGLRRYLQVSTDEVYGHLGNDDPPFTEDSPIHPRSPYSASKASADHLVLAYGGTYGLPVVITRCSNNYGPYQYPEKLIPVMVSKALDRAPLPVYGNGLNIRDWIHVSDHCAGILAVLDQGRDGQVYNIGGDSERTNLDVVKAVLAALDRPESLISYVTDRPGHDWRYAMDARKLKAETGWAPTRRFEAALEETVRWYVDRQDWWRPLVKAGG